ESSAKSAVIETDSSVSTVRIEIRHLDKLMNLVGELVLNRNQILETSGRIKDTALQSNTIKLNQLTTELQEGIMKTRLQPIKTVWNQLHKVVRNLSLELGKKARLEFQGEDTELDKSILEAVKDPLMHIIRNCMDHGIETPEKRKQNGKNEEGHILLKAFHEGGQVSMQISDDGEGINVQKIREKAFFNGLITKEQKSEMNDSDLLNLIFLPGFSTSETVTNVSGRGVGMDVVKSNLQKIGGTVNITNFPGKGILFKITIPLTLTIIPALIINCGGYKFAIPQTSLLEIVELSSEKLNTEIRKIHESYVYHLREEFLTVIFLDELLKLPEKKQNSVSSIIIVQSENQKFGIIVDEALDTEEIVVKPLGKHVQNIFAYSGVTILGDGKIALILNIQNILENIFTNIRNKSADELDQEQTKEENSSYVIFEVSGNYRLALPLNSVLRIEEINPAHLKTSAGKKVLSYRDKFIPTIWLSGLLLGRDPEIPETGIINMLIYQDKGYTIGFIISNIIDIAEGNYRIYPKDEAWKDMILERSILGSILYENESVDVLDAEELIQEYKKRISDEVLSMVH
ncbi:MAG TPA: chemotaxis protein CheA, partial [Leptospiraceae bacterium]|nr:chemotaxis protein CheA [Leptospiraceae bacterium]